MHKFIILLLICCVLYNSPAHADNLTGTVVSVQDGDTITVKPECVDFNFKIRLVGIDAPELKQEYGLLSKQHLTDKLLDKVVQVVTDKSTFDGYGRILGFVYIDDENVNVYQVKMGMAMAEPVSPNITKSAEIKTAEIWASDNKLGFWKTGGLKQLPKHFRKRIGY